MTANTINGQYQTVLGIYQNLHLPSSEALKTHQNVNCNILDLHCARTLLDVSTQVAASEGRVVALQSIGRPTISGNYKYKYTYTSSVSVFSDLFHEGLHDGTTSNAQNHELE